MPATFEQTIRKVLMEVIRELPREQLLGDLPVAKIQEEVLRRIAALPAHQLLTEVPEEFRPSVLDIYLQGLSEKQKKDRRRRARDDPSFMT